MNSKPPNMHLAYSALHNSGKRMANRQSTARWRGYLAACQKHQDTIAAIKQHLPDWEPPFQPTTCSNSLQVQYK
jgi:hypothetical protein